MICSQCLFKFIQHVYPFLCLSFLLAALLPFGLLMSLYKAGFHFRKFYSTVHQPAWFVFFQRPSLIPWLQNIYFFTTPNVVALYSVSDHLYWSDFATCFCSFSLTMLYFPTGERWRQSVPMYGFMWAMFLGTLSIGILWDLGWDCILL